MTTRDYMINHPRENLEWCAPYITDDNRYAIAINEGEIVSMQVNGQDIDPTPNAITDMARAVNPYFDDYSGYTPTRIALYSEKFHQTGCKNCPWFGICDAMDEETYDPDD